MNKLKMESLDIIKANIDKIAELFPQVIKLLQESYLGKVKMNYIDPPYNTGNGQFSQNDLWDTVSNIKDGRSDIDLLYGCLLDWCVRLTMPHATEKIESSTVHTVDSSLTDEIDLIACFDSKVSETVVRNIAKRKPTRTLFRDSSFVDSANKINVFEIFKSISPDTTVKVI